MLSNRIKRLEQIARAMDAGIPKCDLCRDGNCVPFIKLPKFNSAETLASENEMAGSVYDSAGHCHNCGRPATRVIQIVTPMTEDASC